MSVESKPLHKGNKKHLSFPTTICGLFLLFVFLLSIYAVTYLSKNSIDSDASSELILAEHLAKTNQILSRDWTYSTELRIIDTQILNSLLFRLTDNWQHIRIGSGLIHQMILLLSYLFFCRKSHFSLKASLLTCSLLLLPINVAYGRIVLYHNYYVPHIAFSFLTVGLLIGALENKNKHRTIDTLLLFAIAFLSGLKGVRHLLITFVPLLMVFTIRAFIRIYKQKQRFFSKETIHMFTLPVVSLIFCLLGFLGNCVLAKFYTFRNYKDNILWELMPISELPELLQSYLYQFGFRNNIKIISLLGFLSAIGIGCGTWAIVESGKSLIRKTEYDQTRYLTDSFFSCVVGLTVFIFLFAYKDYGFILYLIPCIVWIFPLIAGALDRISLQKFTATAQGLIPLICTVGLIINGFINLFWLTDDIYFQQEYEGLSFKDNSIVSSLSGPTKFLDDHNMTVGYASFWHANILTEMTNGKIRMIPVHILDDFPAFNNWLTFKIPPKSNDGNTFLLLSTEENFYQFDNATLVYDDGTFFIYQFNDNELRDRVFRFEEQ